MSVFSFAAVLAAAPASELEARVRGLFPAPPHAVQVGRQAALAGGRIWRRGHCRLVGRVRIDNGPELRSALGLASGEDAELVLAAWARWGAESPRRLVGDFAFVLWDEEKRILLAARDGLGMATLCYRRQRDLLLLAGETEQLLGKERPALRLVTLAGWLGGWPDPHASLFEGVEVLPPGHALVVEGGRVSVSSFWRIDPARKVRYRSLEEYAEHLAELLSRAVRDRLRSPFPRVATQMSGGMDSTSVTALAAEAREKELLVVSHTYDNTRSCDEQALVREMQSHLGLTDVRLLPAESFLDLGYRFLYPPARESPGTVLSPRYREEVKLVAQAGAGVLLTGSGGDELTWGHALTYLQRLKRGEVGVVAEVVRGCREQQLPVLRTLWQLFGSPLVPEGVRRTLGRADGRRLPEWIRPEAVRRFDLKARLLEEPPAGFANPALEARWQALRRSATYNAVRSWAKVAESREVEVRHPFFDTRLVEFSFAVPDHLWNREGYPKWLLRKAMSNRLPEAVCWNRKKVVFDDFFVKVIRSRPEQVRETLLHPWLEEAGLLDRQALLRAWEETVAGRRPFHVDLLYALMTQAWVERETAGEA